MRLIDADKLTVDMEETVYCGDGTYKIFGYSKKQIDSATTINLDEKSPMTLEELREMNGEPVWVDFIAEKKISCWGFHMGDYVLGYSSVLGECLNFYDFAYGMEWIAYRRRPEDWK